MQSTSGFEDGKVWGGGLGGGGQRCTKQPGYGRENPSGGGKLAAVGDFWSCAWVKGTQHTGAAAQCRPLACPATVSPMGRITAERSWAPCDISGAFPEPLHRGCGAGWGHSANKDALRNTRSLINKCRERRKKGFEFQL